MQKGAFLGIGKENVILFAVKVSLYVLGTCKQKQEYSVCLVSLTLHIHADLKGNSSETYDAVLCEKVLLYHLNKRCTGSAG